LRPAGRANGPTGPARPARGLPGPAAPDPAGHDPGKAGGYPGRSGLEEALDCLHRWELAAGYITREKLEDVERLEFPDPDTGLTFRLQVNHARTRYSDAQESERRASAATPVRAPEQAGPKPCLLCRHNVGSPGKESLRVFELDLDGRDGASSSSSPLPAVSLPLRARALQAHAAAGQRPLPGGHVRLLDLAPGYAVLSNSDVEWAGASILTHLHFQMLRGLRLPVLEARAARESPGRYPEDGRSSWTTPGLLPLQRHTGAAAAGGGRRAS